MKANQDLFPDAPIIEFSENEILVDSKAYTCSLLFDSNWEPIEIGSIGVTEWLQSPMQKTCIQIISGRNPSPSPMILDLFWRKSIPVEILVLKSAVRQAQLLQTAKTPYQLLLFN